MRETIFGPHAYTFDDVLLQPRLSEVLPNAVNLRTRLARDVWLHVPVLSAAMDTITEGRLAIALAREGGIGVLALLVLVYQKDVW